MHHDGKIMGSSDCKKKPTESLSILPGTYNNFKKKNAKSKIKIDSPEI